MKVIKVENQVEGGKVAFEILKEKLANGAQTLGLATGSSPLEFYKEIVESDLDFSNLTSVNLDEYVGLDGDNPQSYRYFMQENLFNQKPFKESFLPRGVKDNAEAEVERYNQILADHPVDLQILGIGRNGHIGFNEPGTPFDIQASGISAIGYAFVTGGVMSMFSIWKNFNLGLKLFYILLIVLSLTMLLPNITGWISTFLHMSGIASYIMVSSINNYRLS